ncbi:MAG: hypothetical protein IH944_08435 [Armatimonadetes bacterium]|nr:hypothetical protein [Armatimonadota bacterium]
MFHAILVLASAVGNPVSVVDDQVTLGTIDIGGRSITMSVPASGGPFNAETPHYELDGFKYALGTDLNLAGRYRIDGGWKDVAAAFLQGERTRSGAPEYPVKVYISTRVTILDHGQDGYVQQRRGSLNLKDVETILQSLAQFKAIAEAAAGSSLRISLDVTIDDDLVFLESASGRSSEFRNQPGVLNEFSYGDGLDDNDLAGGRWLTEDFGVRINSGSWESDDGKYRGPYSSAFVIHAALAESTATILSGETPLTSVSYVTFTDRSPGEALSIQLYEAWVQHVMINAQRGGHPGAATVSLPTGRDLPQYPAIHDAGLSNSLLAAGNRAVSRWGPSRLQTPQAISASDWEEAVAGIPATAVTDLVGFRDAASWTGGRISSVRSGDLTWAFVEPQMLGLFLTQRDGAATAHGYVQLWPGARPRVAVQLSAPMTGETDQAAIAMPAPEIAAMLIVPIRSPRAALPITAYAQGSFAAELQSDPAFNPIVVVTEPNRHRRGFATVSKDDRGQALFYCQLGQTLAMMVSVEGRENYGIYLIGEDGQTVSAYSVLANSERPAETSAYPYSVTSLGHVAGSGWTEHRLDLSPYAATAVSEIRVGPPPLGNRFERAGGERNRIKIGAISLAAGEQVIGGDRAPSTARLLAGLPSLLQPIHLEQLETAFEVGREADVLNALAVLGRALAPEMVPAISRYASSGSAAIAYLAIQALRFQDTTAAWKVIGERCVAGPFDTNVRFAAEALKDKQEKETALILNRAFSRRSWRTRRSAARSLQTLNPEDTVIYAAVSLNDGDATVRLAIVEHADIGNELLSRRLLWTAVNDNNETVRAHAYRRLIDSPDESMRSQALHGIRDESVFVRLFLLEHMADRAQPYYRSALRQAVIDPDPRVRAACLRAFATQPGPVELAEIQNTLNDPDPLVQVALKELVRIKNIELPDAA